MGLDIFRHAPPTLSCCFCCTSKTGGRIIGALEAVFGTMMLVFGLMAAYRCIWGNLQFSWLICLLILTGVINLVFSALILMGMNQDKLHLVKAWLFGQTAYALAVPVVEILDLFVFHLHYNDVYVLLLTILFSTGISLYCILVVSSYYSMKLLQDTQGSVSYNRSKI